jgi:hypothetical protein
MGAKEPGRRTAIPHDPPTRSDQMVGSNRLMARTERSIQVSEDRKIKKTIQQIVGQALRLPSSYGVAAPRVDRGAGRRKPLFKGISLSPQLEGGYSRENHRYTVVSGWKDQQHKNSTFPRFHRSISCSGSAPATRSRVVYGVAPAPPVSVPILQNSNTPSLHVPSTPNREPSSTAGKSTAADSPFFSGIALPPRLVGENNGENH